MKEKIECTKTLEKSKKQKKGSTLDMNHSENSSKKRKQIWTLSRKRNLKRYLKSFLRLIATLVPNFFPVIKSSFEAWIDRKLPEKSITREAAHKTIEAVEKLVPKKEK